MVLFYVDPCVQTKEWADLDLTYFNFDLGVPVSKYISFSLIQSAISDRVYENVSWYTSRACVRVCVLKKLDLG